MCQLTGIHLKAVRESRGQTLADASHATRIPEGRLVMLEQGDLAGFGSMTYARHFLKAYCSHLGVDAAAALDQLPQARPGRMSADRRQGAFFGDMFPGGPPRLGLASSDRQSWRLIRAAFLMTLLLAGLVGFWARHLTGLSLATAGASSAQGVKAMDPLVERVTLPGPTALVAPAGGKGTHASAPEVRGGGR